MRLTTIRAIPLALALAVAGLVVSGVPRFRDAHHGLDYMIGEAAWLVFVAGCLAAIVLAAVAIARRRARGPRTS